MKDHNKALNGAVEVLHKCSPFTIYHFCAVGESCSTFWRSSGTTRQSTHRNWTPLPTWCQSTALSTALAEVRTVLQRWWKVQPVVFLLLSLYAGVLKHLPARLTLGRKAQSQPTAGETTLLAGSLSEPLPCTTVTMSALRHAWWEQTRTTCFSPAESLHSKSHFVILTRNSKCSWTKEHFFV